MIKMRVEQSVERLVLVYIAPAQNTSQQFQTYISRYTSYMSPYSFRFVLLRVITGLGSLKSALGPRVALPKIRNRRRNRFHIPLR
jgi:hypothetical protein